MKTAINLSIACICVCSVFSCNSTPKAKITSKQVVKAETDSLQVEIDTLAIWMFQRKEIVAKMLYGNPTPEQVESVDFDATLVDLNKGIEFFDKEITQTDKLLEMGGCNNWYRQVMEGDDRAKKTRQKLYNLVSIVEAVQQSYNYMKYERYYDRLPNDVNY